MVELLIKQKIILMHRDGISNREIARILGIHRDTVAKYVDEYDAQMQELLKSNPNANTDELIAAIVEAPHYSTKNRGPKTSTLEAKELVKMCLDDNAIKRQTGRFKQQMKGTDIHHYLIKQGFDISYSTVKKLIRELSNTSNEAFIKQVYEPGDSVEFDWGEVKLDIGGQGYKTYQMAAFASSLGNFRFAALYRSQDTAAFQEAHVEFFCFCGGVYHTIVYDNMKVAVAKFVGPTEKEPTEALIQLSSYYGFNYRFCNVRSGNEKGHVERTVDVMRRFAFAEVGKDCFDTLEEANKYLLNKCVEKNLETLTDGRIPSITFELEKPYLMILPPKFPCFVKRIGCKVDKFSTVSVNSVRYSVPDDYVGKRVDVRIYTNRIVFYYDDLPIARHERFYKNGEYHIQILHYLKTLKRKPGALPHSEALLQADTRIKHIYEKYYTKEPKAFLEVLEIIKEKGVDKVEQALDEVLLITPNDLNAEKVRAVCNKENCIEKTGVDRLSEKSKQTLMQYDLLRNLQNKKEAV